jgi:hypothetical protein
MKFLPESEVEFVLGKLKELRKSGNFGTLQNIKQIDWKYEPVSMAQFLDDPYYLHSAGKVLYPKWREELEYVCDLKSGVLEWVLTGSIGVGKTFVSTLAMLYRGPYLLSCLKSPQEYFELEENSKIVFGIFNATLANTAGVDMANLMNFIDGCKYFTENCQRVPVASYIHFPSINVGVIEGSKALHTMGANMFGYVMDEANFMRAPKTGSDGSVEEMGQAYSIYHHAVRRIESRFLKYGLMPGLACLVSSRKNKTSFLEKHMKAQKKNPSVHISDYALWEVKGRDTYSPEEFRVFVGDTYRSPEILDIIDPNSYQILESHPCPEGGQFIYVPCDFYRAFEDNIFGALRDIAGWPTSAQSALITRVESVQECINPERRHPFNIESPTLAFHDPDEADLMNLVRWDEMIRIVQGGYQPLNHPGEPRIIHVDLSQTGDCTGIAMGCQYDKSPIPTYNPLTGETFERFLPKVWLDFALQIRPTKGDKIDISRIVQFILNLRNKGFGLQQVTFDGYQSAMAIQVIQKANQLPQYRRYTGMQKVMNLNANVLSVDRTDVPYTVLRDCLNYNCIDMYAYKPFVNEVLELEHDTDKKKIDHPEGGSKDVSDAVCGVVYNIAIAKNYMSMDPINTLNRNSYAGVDEGMMRGIIPDRPEGKIIAISPAPKMPRVVAPPGLSTGLQTQMKDFSKYLK